MRPMHGVAVSKEEETVGVSEAHVATSQLQPCGQNPATHAPSCLNLKSKKPS
jgi:hypothetical protein